MVPLPWLLGHSSLVAFPWLSKRPLSMCPLLPQPPDASVGSPCHSQDLGCRGRGTPSNSLLHPQPLKLSSEVHGRDLGVIL